MIWGDITKSGRNGIIPLRPLLARKRRSH